eukprot:630719-Hanusia_phi.AAC.1
MLVEVAHHRAVRERQKQHPHNTSPRSSVHLIIQQNRFDRFACSVAGWERRYRVDQERSFDVMADVMDCLPRLCLCVHLIAYKKHKTTPQQPYKTRSHKSTPPLRSPPNSHLIKSDHTQNMIKSDHTQHIPPQRSPTEARFNPPVAARPGHALPAALPAARQLT